MSPTQTKPQVSALATRVQGHIRQKRLCAPKEQLLVGVSGGADSTALLHVLKELMPAWNWRLSAVHVNYGLRGAESEEDAAFVEKLCRELEIPFFCEAVTAACVAHVATTSEGRPNSSLQARARDMRYAIFCRIADRIAADKIVLGHTADDQAETLLLWMMRGAGTTGLSGIPEVREGTVVRPLLEVSRDEIIAYLRERGLRWREDSSNAAPIYARNRIRRQLLPVLKDLSPAVVKVLGRQARILRDEDRCLDQFANEQFDRLVHTKSTGMFSMKREGLAALPLALQRRVIRAATRSIAGRYQGPSFGTVEAIRHRIVHGQSGASLEITGGVVWREYDQIWFQGLAGIRDQPRRADATSIQQTIQLVEGSETVVHWEPSGRIIRLTLTRAGSASGESGSRTKMRIILDADRIVMPLTVRTWRPGDWFQPSGMQGQRKKLQDYFADAKVPRHERHRVPLLVGGEQVLWVAGYRADHRMQPSITTTRVLIVTLEDKPDMRSRS